MIPQIYDDFISTPVNDPRRIRQTRDRRRRCLGRQNCRPPSRWALAPAPLLAEPQVCRNL